jgi:hypothetical protein
MSIQDAVSSPDNFGPVACGPDPYERLTYTVGKISPAYNVLFYQLINR